MGFSTTPKLGPHLYTSFEGGKHENNDKYRIIHFQMLKLCCEFFPINNFKRQNLYVHMIRRQLWKRFLETMPNYAQYNDFSSIIDWCKCAMFQTAAVSPKRLHRFACEVYSWKGITWSKSRRIYLAHKGAINLRRPCSTAIAVHLVFYISAQRHARLESPDCTGVCFREWGSLRTGEYDERYSNGKHNTLHWL